MTDGEHLVDGRPHFLNVPIELLPDFGRLAILSARIEHSASTIAALLGSPLPSNGRTRALSTECKTIKERLNAPPWVDVEDPEGWVEEVRAWATTAPTAVDRTRNHYLHGLYAHRRQDGEDWTPHRVDRSKLHHGDSLDAEHLARAVRELVAVEAQGVRLWIRHIEQRPDALGQF